MKLKITKDVLKRIVYHAGMVFKNESIPDILDISDDKQRHAYLFLKGIENTLAENGVEVPFEFDELSRRK